jgi:hypothetical protein
LFVCSKEYFCFSGCRNAIVNLDVRPLDAAMLTRRCVLTKLKELTIEKFREMLTQGAGALVIMLPARESMTEEEKEVHSEYLFY